MKLPAAAFFLKKPEFSTTSLANVYGAGRREQLETLCQLYPHVLAPTNLDEHAEAASKVEVLFTTWGMPALTEADFARMPNLKAIFYAAGSVRHFARPVLERGIVVMSSWAANAVPVAEFTVGQILLGSKRAWLHAQYLRSQKQAAWRHLPLPGGYESTVGLISLGQIGRLVCEYLKQFDFKVIAHDPFIKPEQAGELGVELVDLPTLFKTADIVSLHTPWLKETEGLITGAHLASMKPNSTFINTSRGAVVKEDEMLAVLQQRSDLTAVIDVTYPKEPPLEDSPFYTLPNVMLTPHVAGSSGPEVVRMADYAIAEFKRWRDGQPMKYSVSLKLLETMA